jgi:hypothetical protein
MKKLFVVLASLMLLFGPSLPVKAQSAPNTTVFTFIPYGSAGVNYQIKTQDGQPVESYPPYYGTAWYLGFQTSGFDNSPGFYIDLPVDPDPTNGGGALNLEGCDPAVYDAKVFTVGDGTHAGDAYTLTAHVGCSAGNGYSAVINTNWVLAQGKCKAGGGRYWTYVPCKPGQGLYGVPQAGNGQLTSLYVPPAQ